MSERVELILAELRAIEMVCRRNGETRAADELDAMIKRRMRLESLDRFSKPTYLEMRGALDLSEAAVQHAIQLSARYGDDYRARLRALKKSTKTTRRKAFGSSEVYVLLRRDVALVKIGVSTNVKQRISSFRRASGGNLELLHHFPGVREDEQALHRRFAAYRKDGEWFAYARELKQWINQERVIPRANA